MRLFDISFLTPPNFFIHRECWSGCDRNKKIQRGLWLFWHMTIWVLWKAWNDKTFNDVNWEAEEIVEEIKVVSWWWMLSRIK